MFDFTFVGFQRQVTDLSLGSLGLHNHRCPTVYFGQSGWLWIFAFLTNLSYSYRKCWMIYKNCPDHMNTKIVKHSREATKVT